MKTFVVRMVTVALVGAVSSFSACCCDPEGCCNNPEGCEDDGGEPPCSIAFQQPRHGDTLNDADDNDGAIANGIQYNVRVHYCEEGTQLQLDSDQGYSDTAIVDDDDVARFDDFRIDPDSAPGAEVTLTVTDGVESAEITITAISAVVPDCNITSPADGAALTNDSNDLTDGFQTPVAVTCTNIPDGTDVNISLDGEERGTDQLSGGQASFELTLAADGEDEVISIVAVDENDDEIAGTADSVTVSVPVGACNITINDPADMAVIDASATDADPNTPGFQYAVQVSTGAATCAGATVEVTVDGSATFTETLDAAGAATVNATLPDGAYDIEAVVTGAQAGASDTVSVTVDTNAPTIELTSPEDGAVYGPSDDEVPATADVISVALTGTIDGATDSSGWSLTCGDGTMGMAALPGDGTAFDENLPEVDPATGPSCTLTVTASDGVNTTTVEVTYQVGLISLQTELSSDDNDDGYLIASEDEDPGTATDMDANFLLTPTFSSGSWTARAELWSLGADPADPGDDVQIGGDIDLGALSTGVGAAGSVTVPYGEQAYEIRIYANDGSADVGPAIISFTVDTAPPGMTWTSPTEGLVLNASTDQQAATPGYQPNLLLTTTGIVGQTVDLVFDNSVDPVINETCVVDSGGNCGRNDITLTDGNWTATATATDAAGNMAMVVVSFTVDASVPAIVDPITDNFVIVDDANNDGTLNLAESGDAQGAAISDVTVTFDSIDDNQTITLSIDGAVGPTATTNANAVTFTNVSLPEGAYELGVSGSDAAGNFIAAGAARTFTVDTVPPTLTVPTPAPGTLTNDAVTFSIVTDAEDNQTVNVEDITNNNPLGMATVSAGGAAASVTLPQGDVDVEFTVSDQAGNTTALVQSYTVDSVAPTLTLTLLSDPAMDSNAGAPGFQQSFRVDHSGLETGQTITITATPGGQVGTGTAEADGSVDIEVTLVISGTTTFVATADDVAGNTGTSNSVMADVVTGDFSVFLDDPTPVGNLITYGIADVSGGEATIVVTVPTFPIGGNIELRIDGVVEPTANYMRAGDTFTITWDVNDGDSGTIEVYVEYMGTEGTTGVLNYLVDLGAPTVSWNGLVDGTVFNISDDTQPGVSGLQTNVDIVVTGCENGTIDVFEGATRIGGPTSVDATGAGTIQVAIDDPIDHENGTWDATCTDQAGNAATTSLNTVVDTTAPGVPTVGLSTVDPQKGQVDVTVLIPGDDGATGDPVTLQVAASRTSMTAATFPSVYANTFVAGLGGGLWETTTGTPGNDFLNQTSGLAFQATWYIAALATDAEGNTSFSQASVADLTLLNSSYTHTNDGIGCADDLFARAAAHSANFNNDAYDDLILAAPGEGDQNTFGCFYNFGDHADGAIYLYTGTADLANLDVGSPTVRLFPGDSYALGKRLDTGDFNGDGFTDIAAYAENQAFPFDTRVYIYYGTDADVVAPIGVPDLVDPTPVRLIIGGGDPSYDFWIDSVRNVGDINGDGYDDLYFGPRNAGTPWANQFEGHILFGQSTRYTDNTNISAYTTTVLQETSGGVLYLGTAIGLGAADADAYDDFVVRSQGRGLLVVRGRAAGDWPATLDLATDVTGGDVIACPGNPCGYELAAGDVNGDGYADLLATEALLTRVNVYLHDGVSALSSTYSYRIRPPGGVLTANEGVMAVGDVNADGFDDVIVGQDNGGGATRSAAVYLGGEVSDGHGLVSSTRVDPDAEWSIAFSGAEPLRISACGDLDDDGDDDICYTSESGTGSTVVRYR